MARRGFNVVRGVTALKTPLEASVVTLGTFDGVHLGHAQLISRAVREATDRDLPAVAYTFDPTPAQVLAPELAPGLLVSIDERIQRIAALGINTIVVEPFTIELSKVPADDWVQRYLIDWLRPEHVVVGFNFTYGHHRRGDAAHLEEVGKAHGFTVDVVSPIEISGEVVSSTRIRKLLEAGDAKGAAKLLGRPFALRGQVAEGRRMGRTLGIPTANLEVDTLVPRRGVYASRATLEDGSSHSAVTNIGVRPTFDAGPAVETHILDFDRDIYAQAIEVQLIDRLRDERKFNGPTELVEQIQRDIAKARELLG